MVYIYARIIIKNNEHMFFKQISFVVTECRYFIKCRNIKFDVFRNLFSTKIIV